MVTAAAVALVAFLVFSFAVKACTTAAAPLLAPTACPAGQSWLPAPEFAESGARECRQ